MSVWLDVAEAVGAAGTVFLAGQLQLCGGEVQGVDGARGGLATARRHPQLHDGELVLRRRPRTVQGRWHCVQLCAASVWNKLPLSVRSLNSSNSFKSHLKTHLFAHH